MGIVRDGDGDARRGRFRQYYYRRTTDRYYGRGAAGAAGARGTGWSW